MVNPGSNMMTIPEVRDALSDMVLRLRDNGQDSFASELQGLIEQLKRRSAKRVTPVKSHKATEVLKAHIRAYAANHPNASQMEIAAVFHLNPGRVSEALSGKR